MSQDDLLGGARLLTFRGASDLVIRLIMTGNNLHRDFFLGDGVLQIRVVPTFDGSHKHFCALRNLLRRRRVLFAGERNIDYVKLVSSEKAALRAVKGGKGGGHTGYMTAGIVGAGILFFPVAPFFRLMHGKDIPLPEGNRVHCLCQRRCKARYCEVSARSRAATGSKRQQA